MATIFSYQPPLEWQLSSENATAVINYFSSCSSESMFDIVDELITA
jgi:hypothetical protein